MLKCSFSFLAGSQLGATNDANFRFFSELFDTSPAVLVFNAELGILFKMKVQTTNTA